ncbi:hypothetical protein JP75_00315 [Devosia riboflavina]|uniref:Flagellin n=1 Tax=Devosia riboflavina TaxID=46914 RepID=A0A087M6Y9_9HYPH|nr:flagellin [Devosia riboflavina]KFL32642.1 hypothetical protein JP75_00315 [Devosia riboflavina]
MGSDISLSKAVRSNLLSLQNTAEMMNKTQNRLATGNKVNSALDNPSNFFTASALNSRAADMSNLLDSMASGIKVIEAADKGITAITKNIESMQSTLRQARQDKSFQTDNYEVGKDSTLKLSGGQFPEGYEVKLQSATGGEKATVSFDAAYGDAATSAAATGQGAGARALIQFNAAGNWDGGEKIKIDGREITLAAGAIADETALAAAITTALGAGSGYTVTQDTTTNQVIIENNDKTKASPVVEFVSGVNAATYGETSFTYNATHAGTVTVGGQQISNGGASFTDFVKSLEDKAKDGGYTVVADATTQKITLRSAEPNQNAPSISGLNQTGASNSSNSIVLTGADATAGTIQIDGVDLGAVGGANADAVGGNLVAAITGNATLNARYSATYDAATDTFTLTNKTAGEGQAAATIGFTGLTANPGVTTFTNTPADTTGITVTSTNGTNGAHVKTVEAASHKFTVTYGDKSADINVVGRDGSPYDKTNQLDLINNQLKAAGINDVTASFDADDKLVFTANNPEGKTLAVSGKNVALFGTDNVSTGKEAVSAYKSSNTVDQFVEEINRNAATAGKIRASNDNGKLRIENLSTQQLDVEFDKDGAGVGAPTQHKIAGNVIRDNLAKQFNDLRDQLDKFADDSSFNGINLLRGDKLTITFNESGSSSIQIQAKDKNGNERPITAANLNLESLVGQDLDNDTDIDALLGKLSTALSELRSQASTFGSNLSSVENRQTFTKNMINTLETGAANLTLADTNEEAANLLALQTRQQLSSSALSMASQQDQAVLQLLR